jgi:hypothetical protein
LFEALAVRALVISMIQATFRTFLMHTVRRPTLLVTASLLTPFAAVPLTSVARATDIKHSPALSVAAKPLPKNGFRR